MFEHNHVIILVVFIMVTSPFGLKDQVILRAPGVFKSANIAEKIAKITKQKC